MTGSKPSTQPGNAAGMQHPRAATSPRHEASRFAAAAMPPHFQARQQQTPSAMQNALRSEPHLNGDSAQHPIDEEYVRNYESLYGQYESKPPRPVSRILLMAAVFIVGTAAGLAGAWWMSGRTPQKPVALGAVVSPVPIKELRLPKNGGRPVVVRGISASELPYDGAPPPAEVSPGRGESTSTAIARSATSVTGSRPALQQENDRRETLAPSTSAKPAEKVSNQSKIGLVKAESASQKSRSASQIARDREINRIRQQADDELKKKTEKRRPVEEARAGSRQRSASRSSARVQTVKVNLAKCELKSNFFSREVCKWRLCNGRWGKNGCPSYATPASLY